MLLSIETIRKELDDQFLSLEPAIHGFRLVPKKLKAEPLRWLEQRLNVTLPSEFADLVSSYDFGDLTIGPVAFCGSGDYLMELVELNEPVKWWGNGPRPAGMMMIANSDPFSIILNTSTGAVLGFRHEEGWKSARVLARDFSSFFRGLGTAMRRRLAVADKGDLARQISHEVSAEFQEFWVQLVLGSYRFPAILQHLSCN